MSLYERTTAPHTSRITTQERTRTMGASRDFTTGTDTGAATTLLEPGRRAVPQRTRVERRTVPRCRRAAETAWVRSRLFLSVAAVFHSSR